MPVYAETLLKLVGTLCDKDEVSENDLEQLFTIGLAQIQFLQEEYQHLLVRNAFDPNTSRFFRTMRKNTSAFRPETIDTLKDAAVLAQAQALMQQAKP